ncbi:hypothetical protein SMICM17S_10034 [Streptomyces microflavus]
MGGRVQVGDGPQSLLRLVHGEFRRQPFPQEPPAAAFLIAVGTRLPPRFVQLQQRGADEVGGRVLAGR